jgi:WD40 repeat protein
MMPGGIRQFVFLSAPAFCRVSRRSGCSSVSLQQIKQACLSRSPAECVNTFDAHEDKVWALALRDPSGRTFASGGGDGSLVVWEDCTAEDAAEAAEAAEEAVMKEQDLANALKVPCCAAAISALWEG